MARKEEKKVNGSESIGRDVATDDVIEPNELMGMIQATVTEEEEGASLAGLVCTGARRAPFFCKKLT